MDTPGGTSGPDGGNVLPGEREASGGPLPGGDGTVAGAKGDSRNDASGDASEGTLGDGIISSDEHEEGPEDMQEVDGHGNPVLRSPFKRPPSQRRERRDK